MKITVNRLEAVDIPDLAAAFFSTVWKAKKGYFKKIFIEQQQELRVVLVARRDEKPAGFVSVLWQSKYPPFAAQNIPEVNDLRVLEQYRRSGIATALMDGAEKTAFKRSPRVGLGVGLYADYGPAQRLYPRRGYIPDGRGLMYNEQPVRPGNPIFVDDSLVLYLVKEKPAA